MSKLKNANEKSIKILLRQFNTHAKKRLGQHFLIDKNVVDTILKAAELNSYDNVIEVGPGLGILTVQLSKIVKRVFAVELDSKLATGLQKKLSNHNNVIIINNDILKVNIPELLQNETNYKVVANLPYYITSPVLQYFTDAPIKPQLMVIMVQKEVADAITAKTGNFSILAINLKLFTTSEIIEYVPADSFYPKPKVDSAIIRLRFLPKSPIAIDDIDKFMEIVRCGFTTPRKQLRNSLAFGIHQSTNKVVELLKKANIEPSRRAETLDLTEWQKLYETMKSDGLI